MEAPEAYAHKVMLNTFLSWRRRRWTAEVSTDRFADSPAATGGFAAVNARESLRHALRQLTARQRAVIALRYYEDRSEAETAAIMGCTVGTVKIYRDSSTAAPRVASVT
jgi:RNA polymerase sigma factor (sigma-70 family)